MILSTRFLRSPAYKNYLLVVLLATLSLTYVDRMVFGMTQQAIKSDLQLSDAELGALSGVAFAIFFSVMGLPIARWADRGDRILIVALTTAMWATSVVSSALTGTFWLLFFARSAIAVGEAGCFPPAHSLIPEYFDRAARPRAVGRYMLGVPIGLIIGFAGGGWLNQLYGWRVTFVIVGLPGFALAAVAALTLSEPRRADRVRDATLAGSRAQVRTAFKAVITELSANATFRSLLLCFFAWHLCAWTYIQWIPTFFVRSHSLATGELGTWLAFANGGGSLLGTYLGAEGASRYASHNERLQLSCAAVLFVAIAILNATAVSVSDYHQGFAALTVAATMSGAVNGPLFATLQTLVPARMRATALTLIGLLPSFVGMGLGPLSAGALSDVLSPWVAQESVRYALLSFCPLWCLAAWFLWRASRSVTRDILRVSAGEDSRPVSLDPEQPQAWIPN